MKTSMQFNPLFINVVPRALKGTNIESKMKKSKQKKNMEDINLLGLWKNVYLG